MEPRFADS